MKIADNIEMLQIGSNFPGEANKFFNPTVIYDDKDVILVDTGLPKQVQDFRDAFEKAGIPFDRLNYIIITHHDIDHIGCLPELLEAAGGRKITVMAHEAEKPHIEGDKLPIKTDPEIRKKMEKNLPEGQRLGPAHIPEYIPKAKVDVLVKDGEILPMCGGITIVHTPGHTPGHISLYLEKQKVFISGDALNAAGGKLTGPDPQHSVDVKFAIETLKKLSKYDIETVICYHGGVCKGDMNKAISELTK